MRFIIDHNAPDSVAAFLRARGHEVFLVREILMPDAPDPVIAAMGDDLEAIVVTWNHKDFKALASRMPTGTRATFRRLGRISLRCRAPRAVQRLEVAIDYIEFEYARRQRLRDRRLIIEISDTSVTIVT